MTIMMISNKWLGARVLQVWAVRKLACKVKMFWGKNLSKPTQKRMSRVSKFFWDTFVEHQIRKPADRWMDRKNVHLKLTSLTPEHEPPSTSSAWPTWSRSQNAAWGHIPSPGHHNVILLLLLRQMNGSKRSAQWRKISERNVFYPILLFDIR